MSSVPLASTEMPLLVPRKTASRVPAHCLILRTSVYWLWGGPSRGAWQAGRQDRADNCVSFSLAGSQGRVRAWGLEATAAQLVSLAMLANTAISEFPSGSPVFKPPLGTAGPQGSVWGHPPSDTIQPHVTPRRRNLAASLVAQTGQDGRI